MSKTESDAISAYEIAVAALSAAPNDLRVKHQAVLALARAGAVERACAEYRRLQLDRIKDDEDTIALSGRLLKDLAFESAGEARIALARQSAAKYQEAFGVSGGFYPAVNVATMSLLAGAEQEVIDLWCTHALAALQDENDDGDVYFVSASRAEIALLQGRTDAAKEALEKAIARDRLNYTAHASTLKQFQMILSARRDPLAWLDDYRPPAAAHYAGHMFAIGEGGLDETQMARLEVEISEAIQRRDIGFGYGALAAGGDILIAETLLGEGADLHVFLPAQDEAFIEASVRPFGEAWVERFHACKARASSVKYLVEKAGAPTAALAHFGSCVAMGLAVMRGASLSTRAEQLLICDGAASMNPSATARDAAAWKATGRAQTILSFPGGVRVRNQSPLTAAPSSAQISTTLTLLARPGGADAESEYDPQAAEMLTPFLEHVCDSGEDLIRAEVSGLELRAEFEDAGAAARCAFSLNRLRESLEATQASDLLAFCAGLHCGPAALPQAQTRIDGGEATAPAISLSARIAEAAVPGSIYVSEPAAAMLAAFHSGEFACEYAGRRNLAGRETQTPLFSLRKANVFAGKT